MRLSLFVSAVLGMLLFSSCKDEGVESYRAARARYMELVDQRTSPRDPAFDEVRQKLKSVPKDSDAYADAQKLLSALNPNRPIPGRPLATVPQQRTDADAGQTDAECERIAQELGRADAGMRAQWIDALKACRQRLERERAHSDDPEHVH